jgi:aspartyl-tRNA(Asn)/glutamyl-tRNA(Gln) amidotransferase subunit A
MKLSHMTGWQLKRLLENKEISCRELMVSVLDEIEYMEPNVQAYITIRDKDELLSEAEQIDKRRLNGQNIGNLAGLPVAVKDNVCTKNLLTSCASKMLSNFIPPYNATIIDKICSADGIILGKTNLDEFCMGSSTEKSAFKITRNPHNSDYVPGGTSGGSAAAVAANETILAIGVDTGGSIRQPASYCGAVGIKPTYGRVSRYGIIAYGSSLDQAGPITKDLKDAALLMQVISGHDPKDSTSAHLPELSYTDCLSLSHKFRIGVPKEYFGEGLAAEVKKSVEKAISLFQEDGHEIVPITLPHTEYAVPAYYIISCSEASSNLSRYTGVHFGLRTEDYKSIEELIKKSRSKGFGPEVQTRILLGTYALSQGYYDAYYLTAAKIRTLLKQDFENAFKKCDVIAHPVAPGPAFKIGEKMDANPLTMYLVDIYSVIANLTGLPAISIPCGCTDNKLPIGIQLTGKYFSEDNLLSAAYIIEQLLEKSGCWVRKTE